MSDKVAVIREFLALIDRAIDDKSPETAGRLLGMLADTIKYQSKPLREINGKQEFLQWFQEFAACTRMHQELRHAAQDGNWVLTERLDEWTINGITVGMESMGLFEVRDDGKIHTWKDYIPYTGKWEEANQMPPGFFQRWGDPASIIKKK